MKIARAVRSLPPVVAVLFTVVLIAGVSGARVDANTDPSCIAREQAAGPCKTKPFGPTYYAPGCTTKPDQQNRTPKPGYIGAPCKENDGTAFSVGGTCVPGAKCLCKTCKADGDMMPMMMMPMLPMLPMPMMMPKMDMPMMPMMQPCPAVPTTQTTSSTTETTPIVRTVIIDGVATTATTTRSTTTPVTTTVSMPSRDCLCQQNPYAEGCQASGSSGVLGSFGGSGSLWQSTGQSALNALGGIANSVGSSVINSAANAIESLTGIDIDTNFTNPGPTSIVVSPVGSNADTAYAQAAYTGATTQMAPINQQPQYAYDADTTQYGAFSGQPEDPSTIAVWTNALSNVLTQLGQTLASLFGIL